MHKTDSRVIGITALLTALVTTPILWSVHVSADPTAKQALKAEKTPVLVAKGCEIRATVPRVAKGSETRKVVLDVRNTTDKQVMVPVTVYVTEQSFKGRGRFSRMGPRPVPARTETVLIELGPNQRNTFTLKGKFGLLPGGRLSVAAEVGSKQMRLAHASSPIARVAPVPAPSVAIDKPRI